MCVRRCALAPGVLLMTPEEAIQEWERMDKGWPDDVACHAITTYSILVEEIRRLRAVLSEYGWTVDAHMKPKEEPDGSPLGPEEKDDHD